VFLDIFWNIGYLLASYKTFANKLQNKTENIDSSTISIKCIGDSTAVHYPATLHK
jgi:hypothetical protein